MSDFYLKCRSVSEVMKFYLTQSNSITGSCTPVNSTPLHQPDILNLVGTFSLDFRSKLLEEWKSLFGGSRGSGLILFLGAGGVVLYLIRRRRKRRNSAPSPREINSVAGGVGARTFSKRRGRYQRSGARAAAGSKNSLWSWLFEEELVEDLSRDSYWLRSHYFGPVSPSSSTPLHYGHGASSNQLYCNPTPRKLHSEADEFDVSLNSFTSATATPRKFLKAPLIFDIRQQGKSSRSNHHNPYYQITPGSGGTGKVGATRCNPCPRCVKGTCRIKRHQVYQHAQESSSGSSSALSTSPINKFEWRHMKTSTPDLYTNNEARKVPGSRCRLDGDGSDETEDPGLYLSEEMAKYSGTPRSSGVINRQYRPTHGMFIGSGKRGAPDGKERVSNSPTPQSYQGGGQVGHHHSLAADHQVNTDYSSSGSGNEPTSASATTPERVTTREEYSVESDLEQLESGTDSVTGSMLDLVYDAREVRRLIREVSIDSNASDFSLGGLCLSEAGFCLPDDLTSDTCHNIQAITKDIDELILNCANNHQQEDDNHDSALTTSKSSTSGLYQYASTPMADKQTINDFDNDDSSSPMMKREGSIPDLRDIQATLKKSSKGLWKLTNITGLSDGSRQASVLSDSGGSLEWDSPMHLAGAGHQDLSRHKYRYRTPVLSSNVSECSMDDLCSQTGSCLDQWEWDDAAYYISGDDDEERIVVSHHSNWLPDITSTELDLESELKLRDTSIETHSARSSLSPLRDTARLPPSGRSSADRFSLRRLSSSSRGSSCASDDVTLKTGSSNSNKLLYSHLHYNNAYPPSSTTNSFNYYRNSLSRSRSRDRILHNNSLAGSITDLDVSASSLLECSQHGASSVDTSGISSMNSSMMSSTSSGSLLVSSTINLSPVKEALQEISSPTHRSAVQSPSNNTPKKDLSMEISLGNIRTSDTVIKVQLPATTNSVKPGEQNKATKSKASVALF